MREHMPVLVEVTRGEIVESRHRGVIAALEPDGREVIRKGDIHLVTSTRSTIKPIQAIPVITSGAADRFNFTPREIAVICASHGGESIHTLTVTDMLHRLGLDESALQCGAHPPFHEPTARRLENEGAPFSQVHNNCSGKHTGMLATAVHCRLSTSNYTSTEHSVQREIISIFTRMAGLGDHLPAAVDGCSAPTFGVPLSSLALAFARLVNPWSFAEVGSDIAEAAKRIVAAMQSHPEMVGGTGRFDTDLLRVARGKLVCKVGAEAVYSVGVLPSAQYPRGLGLAFKMEDGSYRGLGPVVIETLWQLGVLNGAETKEMAAYHCPTIESRCQLKVGEVRPRFDLDLNGKAV
ncbi:MAG: asparaginase [Acidobacteriota bacterium]